MAKTLQQILGGRNLTGVINEVSGGVPDDLLPPGMTTPTRGVDGDTGTYYRVSNTRRTSRSKPYGAAGEQRNHQDIDEVPIKLVHSIEMQRHKPTTLINLNSTDGAKQRLGEQEVARQVVEFKRLFTNLRMGMTYSALANGNIWFDGDGELLPSSTGAVVTINFNVPANNQNQLNTNISAVWSAAGTKIITDMGKIRKTARQTTGLPLRHALYGENLPDYLLTNTQVKELLNRQQETRASLIGGVIPNGLFGLDWWPMNEAFYEDSAGANQEFFGADTLIFTPDPSPEWWDMPEGTYPVPTTIDVSADAAAALASINVVQGMFSYATVTTNPVGIEHVAGDTVLPLLRNPSAIYIATVAGF